MDAASDLEGPAGRPGDLVQSVARALRVLEVVGDLPGLPVKVIARRTGLNLSTTYHLVRTLAYQGYLRRLPDGRYVLGGEVARRFHALVASLARPPRSSVVLQHLAGRTALSAYLGRLSDGRVLIADLAEGPGSPYLEDMEVGLDVAIHATALGKALLAGLPPRDRRAYLTEALLRPTPAGPGPNAAGSSRNCARCRPIRPSSSTASSATGSPVPPR